MNCINGNCRNCPNCGCGCNGDEDFEDIEFNDDFNIRDPEYDDEDDGEFDKY